MAGRRVAIVQSNYIPWRGYFDLIHDVDLFVFYDDVQFTRRDWRARNRVKSAQGAQWLTIPVGAQTDRLICEVELADSQWQIKHWHTLTTNYGRCPHFSRYSDYFEHVFLGVAWRSLSDLNQALIRHIAREFLGITTEFADSRSLGAGGRKQERLLDLLGRVGATSYVSGPAAQAYIEPERFAERGIALHWKDYTGYPDYAQPFPPFDPVVSIVDLLFNVGPDAPCYLWGWRG
jgi:hypothetical protein